MTAITIRQEQLAKVVSLGNECKRCFAENGGCFPDEINCFYEGCDDLPESQEKENNKYQEKENNKYQEEEDNQDETMFCPFCKTEVKVEGCYYFGTPGIACYECGSIIEA